MSSEDVGGANRAAADCLYTLEKFLKQFDGLRINQQKIINLGGQPPASYTAAFERAKSILIQLAVFLSDSTGQPHVGAPIINPHMTLIIKSEDDILKKLMEEIDDAQRALNQRRNKSPTGETWSKRLSNKLSKAFTSADIIIGQLRKVRAWTKFYWRVLETDKELDTRTTALNLVSRSITLL